MTTSIPPNSTPESIAGILCPAGPAARTAGIDAAAFPAFQLAVGPHVASTGRLLGCALAPVECRLAIPGMLAPGEAGVPAGLRQAQFFSGARAESTAGLKTWISAEPEEVPPVSSQTSDLAVAAPATREQAEAAAVMMASLWQLLGLISRPETPAAEPDLFSSGSAGDGRSPVGSLTAGTVELVAGAEETQPARVMLPAGWGATDLLRLAAAVSAGNRAADPAAQSLAGKSAPAALVAPTIGSTTAAVTDATVPTAANGSTGAKASIDIVLDAVRTIRLETVQPASGPVARPPAPSQFDGLFTVTEKIAAARSGKTPAVEAPRPAMEKKFLMTGAYGDGNPLSGAGITHATGQGDMLPNSHIGKSAVDQAVGVQSHALQGHPPSQPMGDLHEFHPSLVAQRAVAAVERIVDIQTVSRLQPVPSVQIRMTLGGEDLAIKVELHAGTVQTQFRTSSAELCQAIAQQWSAVKSEMSERSVHFLEPVFVTAGEAAGGETAGDFTRQGHTSQRQGQPTETEVFGAPGRSYPYRQNGQEAGISNPLPPAQPTSLHLSAVA
jgi:hypothetical protein